MVRVPKFAFSNSKLAVKKVRGCLCAAQQGSWVGIGSPCFGGLLVLWPMKSFPALWGQGQWDVLNLS